jgi:hypothetical protein
MRLDDCYRLLDLDPRARTDEIKRAHRDLTKVWHPDRFGHDAALRRKAEEKLKAINEAYETILAARPEPHFVDEDPVHDDEDDAEARAILARRRRVARNRNYALACSLLAIFILLRRPTPAGLVIALVLFVVAVVFVVRLRSIFLDSGRPNL